MQDKKKSIIVLALCCLALAQLANSFAIETSNPQRPVKVTHKNSGPTYAIDLDGNNESTTPTPTETSSTDQVEKKRLTAGDEQPAGASPTRSLVFGANSNSNNNDNGNGNPIVRLFFNGREIAPTDNQQAEAGVRRDNIMLPIRPFLMPIGPPIMRTENRDFVRPRNRHPHILGGDEASRPPVDGVERESTTAMEGPQLNTDQLPALDPMRMMVDLIHQAINEHLAQPQRPCDSESKVDGINKDASSETEVGSSNNSKPVLSAARDEGPQTKPQNRDEIEEEIVEIDGRKYLKKTMTNSHYGDNLTFVTRRLVFLPLQDIVRESPATTEPTATTTTGQPQQLSSTTTVSSTTEAKLASEATTPTATTMTDTVGPKAEEVTTMDTSTSSTTTAKPDESSKETERIELPDQKIPNTST